MSQGNFGTFEDFLSSGSGVKTPVDVVAEDLPESPVESSLGSFEDFISAGKPRVYTQDIPGPTRHCLIYTSPSPRD